MYYARRFHVAVRALGGGGGMAGSAAEEVHASWEVGSGFLSDSEVFSVISSHARANWAKWLRARSHRRHELPNLGADLQRLIENTSLYLASNLLVGVATAV